MKDERGRYIPYNGELVVGGLYRVNARAFNVAIWDGSHFIGPWEPDAGQVRWSTQSVRLVIGRILPRRIFAVPQDNASDDLGFTLNALADAYWRLEHNLGESDYELDACAACNGQGFNPDDTDEWCPACSGTGTTRLGLA